MDYGYEVGADGNGVAGQRYEVSTAFENVGNVDAKAIDIKDNGDNDARLEVGIPNGSGILNLNSVATKWVGQ